MNAQCPCQCTAEAPGSSSTSSGHRPCHTQGQAQTPPHLRPVAPAPNTKVFTVTACFPDSCPCVHAYLSTIVGQQGGFHPVVELPQVEHLAAFPVRRTALLPLVVMRCHRCSTTGRAHGYSGWTTDGSASQGPALRIRSQPCHGMGSIRPPFSQHSTANAWRGVQDGTHPLWQECFAIGGLYFMRLCGSPILTRIVSNTKVVRRWGRVRLCWRSWQQYNDVRAGTEPKRWDVVLC